MNGLAAPGEWQEVKDQTGKTYYWHTATKQTQWEKPAEFITSADVASAWKEYTADGGRKYWHNSETKETTWEEPEALRYHQSQQAALPRQSLASEFVAGGVAPSAHSHDRQLEPYRERGLPERRSEYPRNDGAVSFVAAASANEPNINSLEEAEGVFMKLLRRSGVKSDWTWEEAMRATVRDPQYRAIKDPRDRKAAFDKFVQEMRLQDREKEQERQAKLREEFNIMLRSHPEIQHFTRWRTARPIIEGETIFRSSGNETEKRQLFEEYIIELRKQHADQEADTRKAAFEQMASVLTSLNLEPYTRWQDAQSMLQGNERFRNDAKFEALSKSDVLTAFDSHIKSLERFFNDQKQLEKSRKARRERQHRDKFLTLLNELHKNGDIKAGTKWMDIRPLLEQDARYDAILGQEGSTPLDLFWDVVEEEESVLRRKRNDAADVLVDVGLELRDQSDREAFAAAMSRDKRTACLDEYEVNLVFDRLLEKSHRLLAQDRDDQERRHRRAIDALRSKIKRLEPPVRLTDTWEETRSRIDDSDEFSALPSEELRRSAFEKFMRRLDEKEEHERRGGRRDRERERDTHRSNGRPSRHRDRSTSHTREADVYEADRRRAQADREKSYRRSGTGLSPPRSNRADRDRERYDDRAGRRAERRGSYDHSRRERDVDRERLYSSRADPRDSGVRALDYDEGTTNTSGRAESIFSERSGGRRRRESDPDGGNDQRDNKRARREARESRTPMDVDEERKHLAAEAEDEVLKSGSEEGEIDED